MLVRFTRGNQKLKCNTAAEKASAIIRVMEYVEQGNASYSVTGTRVSLDSIVYAFLRGESAESIAESFPALSLEQVYGAIAYYLAHRAAIDTYLDQGRADFKRMREQARREHPLLHSKLEAAKEQSVSRRR